MPMQTIISQPTSKITTDYLVVPPLSSQQILKYIGDFTNITFAVGQPFINRITFTPGGIQNFGSAKAVRIDTRWMTAPLIFSISDSLNDYIVVPPGVVRLLNIPSSGSDTYTVTLSMANQALPGNTYNFGYVKLFFYNFLGVDWLTPSKPVYATQTVTIPTGGGGINLSVVDSANFSGIPIIDWVRVSVSYALGSPASYDITMFGVPIAPMYFDNPNPITHSQFVFRDTAALSSQTQQLFDFYEPNIQFAVTGTPISVKNEGLLTGAQYVYTMGWNMSSGAATVGEADITVGYHFPAG